MDVFPASAVPNCIVCLNYACRLISHAQTKSINCQYTFHNHAAEIKQSAANVTQKSISIERTHIIIYSMRVSACSNLTHQPVWKQKVRAQIHIWCHPSRVGQLLCGRSKFQSCALGNENSTHAQRARWVKSTKLYGSPLFYLEECLPVHNILVTGAEYISISNGYSNITHLYKSSL